MLNCDIDCLLERYMKDFGVRKGIARQALDGKGCAWLLNTLASDAGLLEKAVTEGLQQERDALQEERERLEDERHSSEYAVSAAKKAMDELDTVRDAVENMETVEMRDRVRALSLFQGSVAVDKSDPLYIAGCVAILSGQVIQTPPIAWGTDSEEGSSDGEYW